MHTHPLEGGHITDVRFFMYDGVGKKVWGEVRVRRENNPDVLVLEGRRRKEPWKPILKLTVVGDNLLYSGYGGMHERNTRPEDTPEGV